MPKILAPLPSAAPAAAAPADSVVSARRSSRGSNAERRAGGFSDVLSGARRREPAPAPASEPTEPRAERGEASPKTDKPAPAKQPSAPARKAREAKPDESASPAAAETGAPVDEGQPAADVAAPAAEHDAVDGETPTTVDEHPSGEKKTTVGGELPPVEVVPQPVPLAGIDTSPAAPSHEESSDVVPQDAATDAEAKDGGDPAHADAEDVRAGQATPVLIAASGAGPLQAPTGDAATPFQETSDAGVGSANDVVADLARDSVRQAGDHPSGGAGVPRQAAAAPKESQQIPSVDAPTSDGGARELGAALARPTPEANAGMPDGDIAVDAVIPDADVSTGHDVTSAVGQKTSGEETLSTLSAATRALESLGTQHAKPQAAAAGAAPAHADNAATLPPEARFAEDNHLSIVAGVRGQLLPRGGTMQIRLDPPELGPLAVTIRLNDGVMEASFETSNDQAAKLLSHSLSTLKQSLEAQGVSVERLHVTQAPKSEQAGQQGGNDRDTQQQNQARDPQQEHAARQEHQRREMLRRMWAKLRGAEDPLDMVA